MEVGAVCQAYNPDTDIKKHHQRHFPKDYDGQEWITENHINVPIDDATEQKMKKPMQEKQSPQDWQRQRKEDEASQVLKDAENHGGEGQYQPGDPC